MKSAAISKKTAELTSTMIQDRNIGRFDSLVFFTLLCESSLDGTKDTTAPYLVATSTLVGLVVEVSSTCGVSTGSVLE